jgi:outer membrane protein OmpA-like peptidoglycan-associated protein
MRPGTNRLLMLLISASLAGCASQTDRSSSGAGAQDATPEVQPAQTAAAPQPDYEPQREEVQYIDRPLEETPAPVTTAAPAPDPVPAPAPTRSAADEPLPDFPITKYEIEEAPAEEVEDLGTQPDESVSGPSLEEETVASASTIGEPTMEPDEPEVAEEVEDLGTQPDESVSGPSLEEETVASGSTIGEPTMEPDEPEVAEEVEDLGTQPDESGTVSYPEDQLAQKDDGIGEPTTYPDEPVQQAATPSSVSVSFEAEPLFSFDKAVIRNDQRKSLDEFVAGLQGVEYDEITAIGHADKLGSDAYNQKLSERRANAVKTYLVSRGVPAGKIRAEGRGESEPVTGDACKGTRGKALISCLQPDRRVDVSASGSKSN